MSTGTLVIGPEHDGGRMSLSEFEDADAGQEVVTVLHRYSGRWRKLRIKAHEKHKTHLLPGLEFDVGAVFAAAK